MSAERRNVPAVIEGAAPAKASTLRSTLAIPVQYCVSAVASSLGKKTHKRQSGKRG